MTLPEATYAEQLHRLAEEQTAVRRIASLVAAVAPPDELFNAVVEEVVRVLGVRGGWLGRFEPDRTVSVLACVNDDGFPAGTRWPLDGPSVCATVLDTGLPARIDDFAGLESTISSRTRETGYRAVSGVPVHVDGSLWGVIAVGHTEPQPAAAGIDTQLRDFAALLGSAISSAVSRDRMRRLAERQASLRRIATLVAEGTPAADLFVAVTEEVSAVLAVPAVVLLRYELDRSATVVASLHAPSFPVGGRWTLDGPSLASKVLETGRPSRIEDTTELPGQMAGAVRASGLRSGVGVPIIVDASVWGVICVATPSDHELPESIEAEMRDFTELVGIAVSNAQSRERPRRLAEQQAALRRVATLVAEGVPATDVFTAVATEVARILDVSSVKVVQGDTVLASLGDPDFPLDDRSVRVPIVVDGGEWGVIAVRREPRRTALPTFAGSYTGRIVLAAESGHEIETRLTAFTQLVATSISKAKADEDLRRLADEQAALRRVATLVAEAAPPDDIFAAVAQEVSSLLELPAIELARLEGDGTGTVISTFGNAPFPPGFVGTLDDPSVMTRVCATSRSARIDDYTGVPGESAEGVRAAGFRSAIGAPIIVNGALWGTIVAWSTSTEKIPERVAHRLDQFTALVGTAVSNATARAELIASRVRLVAAGDEARRRLERNLHDGTQQRLLALRLDVQRIRLGGGTGEELEEIEREIAAIVEEVREVSRGLHPAQLSRGGLELALSTLARRSPIPVALDVTLPERPPRPIETAVYYVVSEALTNAAKHSGAGSLAVAVSSRDGLVHATIADDGEGGAAAAAGSGITGLADRVEALGGRFTLDSPRGRGTTIAIELPIAAPGVH
jgi:signal transduction histidine kinase